MVKRGFVYACSQIDWLEETIFSAKSVQEKMPDIMRELFAPRFLVENNASKLNSIFTQVYPLDDMEFSHRPRFESFKGTSLDQAVFIDGDTYIAYPCYELFDILNEFDVGLTIAPQILHHDSIKSGLLDILPQVSIAIPEYNGGLIVANVNERFFNFIERWIDYFSICIGKGYNMDQASLRIAAVKSDLRIAVLPNNYNFRGHVPQSISGIAKIIHCHGELAKIAEEVNKRSEIRNYIPNPRLIHGFKPRSAHV